MRQINIYNHQKKVPLKINTGRLKDILEYILKKERQLDGVFNFIFVDNNGIRRLNRRYLGKGRITDVIAFPLSDRKGLLMDNVAGEVVLSVEEARRQSRKRGLSIDREIALYCIHGLLHLLGYDDMVRSKRLKMERAQLDYLNRLRRG